MIFAAGRGVTGRECVYSARLIEADKQVSDTEEGRAVIKTNDEGQKK